METTDYKNRILKEKIVGGIFGSLSAIATVLWTYILWYTTTMIPIDIISIPLGIIIVAFGGFFSLCMLYVTFRIVTGYFYYEDVYKENCK